MADTSGIDRQTLSFSPLERRTLRGELFELFCIEATIIF